MLEESSAPQRRCISDVPLMPRLLQEENDSKPGTPKTDKGPINLRQIDELSESESNTSGEHSQNSTKKSSQKARSMKDSKHGDKKAAKDIGDELNVKSN